MTENEGQEGQERQELTAKERAKQITFLAESLQARQAEGLTGDDREPTGPMKFDPAVKAAWIAKLRSGLPQTTQYLCRLDKDDQPIGQCCLGLLADVLGLPFTIRTENSQVRARDYGQPDTPETGVLPLKAAQQVGLSEGAMGFLWRANDEERLTFEEIAQAVEEGL